jgi:hypothetical protein
VKRVLLFCKKAAKNFLNLGLGRFAANATGPDSRKFLRRFFQKAALFAFPPPSAKPLASLRPGLLGALQCVFCDCGHIQPELYGVITEHRVAMNPQGETPMQHISLVRLRRPGASALSPATIVSMLDFGYAIIAVV